MDKFDEANYKIYELRYQEAIAEVRRLEKILAAFGKRVNGTAQVRLRSVVTAPISEALYAFLEEHGKPAHQSEIIKAIGDERHAKYPTLLRPWGDVWKSLEYQARNNLGIVPVEKRGNRWVQVSLEPKRPARRIVGGTEDCAELYEKPDNLFWFKSKLSSKQRRK